MLQRLNFINIILAFLLLLFPFQSFTLYIHDHEITQNVGLYISSQYKPSIPYFKNFLIEENSHKTVELMGLANDVTHVTEYVLKDNTKFNTPYSAKFRNSLINLSGAIGYYSGQGPRLEIEGSYENFDVASCKNCPVKNANRYIALVRDKKPGNIYPQDHSHSNMSYYTFIKNNGISILSVMINGCYDIAFSNVKISPYVCAGIGGDFITLFETMHIKFAYQGKFGISYLVSPSISIFANGHYHKVMDNVFKNLHVKYIYKLQDAPTITSARAKLRIGYFGSEVGVRFVF
uniref:Major outer membrane protein P30-14 n=1 Tax=Ehrlichia canis TaxID=944 RepID=Q9ADW2_EHRCA|nr:major outer membrane protein P30-14 [Ehrlichia canis]